MDNTEMIVALKTIPTDIYKIDYLKNMCRTHSIKLMIEEVAPILRTITSDAFKIEAIKVLRPYIKVETTMSNLIANVASIRTDSYKIHAIKLLQALMVCKPTALILFCILEDIQEDTYKVDALKVLLPHGAAALGFSYSCDKYGIGNIILPIRADTYKIDALKLLVQFNLIGPGDRYVILEMINSPTYKTTAATVLGLRPLTFQVKIPSAPESNKINQDDTDDDEIKKLRAELAKVKEEKDLSIALLKSEQTFREEFMKNNLQLTNTNNEESKCSVCLDMKKEILLEDCDHICLCAKCASSMIETKTIECQSFTGNNYLSTVKIVFIPCPLCRKENTTWKKVFL